MKYQAHRGVSSEYPENTMAAYRAAAEQGYDVIELDPAVTKDGEIILFHDGNLDRTCRKPDGSPYPKGMKPGELTLSEIREADAGIAFGEGFRGEQVPTFAEVLAFSAEHNIPLKIDNKIFGFPREAREKIYGMIESSGAPAHITAFTEEGFAEACARFPGVPMHYDGVINEETMARIRAIGGEREITFWIPMKNPLTAWVKVAFADPALCEAVHRYGRLGLWILSRESEAEEAEALGADIIETTGGVKPKRLNKL